MQIDFFPEKFETHKIEARKKVDAKVLMYKTRRVYNELSVGELRNACKFVGVTSSVAKIKNKESKKASATNKCLKFFN